MSILFSLIHILSKRYNIVINQLSSILSNFFIKIELNQIKSIFLKFLKLENESNQKIIKSN